MCTSLNLSDLSTPLRQQMTVVHDYKASGKHELTCKKGKMSLYFTCREAYRTLIHSINIFFPYGNSCNILPFFMIFCYWCWWFISLFFKEITLFSTIWKVVDFLSVSSFLKKMTNEIKFYKSRQVHGTEMHLYIIQRDKSGKNEMGLYLLSKINTLKQWFKSSS